MELKGIQNIENVIEVKDLCKSFGANSVLNHFDFNLKRGENTVVLGKSGSGKSVFIKCIIGLLEADSGQISVLGKSISNLNSDELDTLRMRMGFLFQSNALYDSMTVRENLEFPLRRHGKDMNNKEVDAAVKEALESVGLPHTEKMMPAELSGGMKKRIAIARTLILKPEIILYDEPTTGLDPITGREIDDLILKIQREYKTSSIIISHDMHCVKAVANRIVMLIDGKAYMEGDYASLSTCKDQRVLDFFYA
jgi:phospholipid/cholesterol/gamma-HCH transport system ATP-binding protein